jgi:hypothetical protein
MVLKCRGDELEKDIEGMVLASFEAVSLRIHMARLRLFHFSRGRIYCTSRQCSEPIAPYKTLPT